MDTPQGRWYTVEEVAEQFRFHVQTIRRLIRKGDLKAIKMGGEFRISEKALYEYIERQQAKGGRAAWEISPRPVGPVLTVP